MAHSRDIQNSLPYEDSCPEKYVRRDWLKILPYGEKDYISHKERSPLLVEASLNKTLLMQIHTGKWERYHMSVKLISGLPGR